MSKFIKLWFRYKWGAFFRGSRHQKNIKIKMFAPFYDLYESNNFYTVIDCIVIINIKINININWKLLLVVCCTGIFFEIDIRVYNKMPVAYN